MIIPIYKGEGQRELCMIELQGELKHSDGLSAGFKIGTLSPHATKADIVYLQIGYHQLEGKKVPLQKPIVILQRVNEDGARQYRVYGRIAHKYMFSDRPKALVSKPGNAAA